MRGAVRPGPAPAPSQTKLISHPAQERSEYALGATSGQTVSISKTYELKSDETVENQPSLLMTGQGTFTFDASAGVPVGLEFKAKVVENSESVTLRVPIQVWCKLLEGAERDTALRFPVMAPTALNPLSDSDVTETLADLKSPDNGKRTSAANRLRDAAPISNRQPAVAQALQALLTDRDGFVRSAVIQAFRPWHEAVDALGKIGHDGASAEAIARWIKQDRGLVLRALEAIGPPAEPAAIALVKSEQDWGTRSEVCKLLGTIGSQACIPTLQEAMKNKKDAFVVMAAEGSLKKLQGAHLSQAEVEAVLDRLKSPDAGRRREAAHKLADASVDPARRSVVCQALGVALADAEESVQREALGALRVWGDRSSARALADRCKDKQ